MLVAARPFWYYNHYMISMVVCVDANNGIGRKNKLLFNIREDMQMFRNLTLGEHVVMGSKTFRSIGKPLSGRVNTVITRSPIAFAQKYDYPLVNCVASIQAITHRSEEGYNFYVIGGGTIYEQFMPYSEWLYVTRVDKDMDADTFFPEIDRDQWNLISKMTLAHKPWVAFEVWKRKRKEISDLEEKIITV